LEDLSNKVLELEDQDDDIKDTAAYPGKSPCLECTARELVKTDDYTHGQYPLVLCDSSRSNLEEFQAQEIPGQQVSRARKGVPDLPPMLLGLFEDSLAGAEWCKQTA